MLIVVSVSIKHWVSSMRKLITTYLFYGLAIILALDLMGFIAWVVSGRVPIDDSVFIGVITTNIIKIFIN